MLTTKANAILWLLALIFGLAQFNNSPVSSTQRRLSDSGDKRSVPSSRRRGVDLLEWRVTKDLEMMGGHIVPRSDGGQGSSRSVKSSSTSSTRTTLRPLQLGLTTSASVVSPSGRGDNGGSRDLTSKASRDTLQAALVAIQTANELTKFTSVNVGFHGSVVEELEIEEAARREMEMEVRESRMKKRERKEERDRNRERRSREVTDAVSFPFQPFCLAMRSSTRGLSNGWLNSPKKAYRQMFTRTSPPGSVRAAAANRKRTPLEHQ